ncbi:unnamed protein product, partial [Rotaria sordida]
MEQTKRHRQQNSITSNNKKKKLSNNSSSITHLEDLPNEIFYEIFGYLDFHYVYKAFSNLNIRFQNLLNYSIHSIKLNISSMSKSTFQYYYTHIIIPNKHCIKSLHLSNPFIINLIFKPFSFSIISNFIQLETLILNNIEKIYLTNILKQLISLPKLHSLVINSVDIVRCNNKFYCQLFRLPTLKYCKFNIPEDDHYDVLPFSTNEYSSIKHLVVENNIHLKKLDALLSYVPQLHRLSIHQLNQSFDKETQIFSSVLKYLTHCSIGKISISFDEFELLSKNIFHHLQVLYILKNCDEEYVNANRWEQLILSHIPYLKIFDIKFNIRIDNHLTVENLMNQFNSSFWFERQWFFTYNFRLKMFNFPVTIYSTRPYRRKYYKLYGDRRKTTDLYEEDTNIDSVSHVEIENEKIIIDCVNYFPNTTKLTLWNDTINISEYSLSTTLNQILPLQQLTTLVILDCYDQFINIIELLSFAINIHTFIIKFTVLNKNNLIVYYQCENFQLVSNRNNIK